LQRALDRELAAAIGVPRKRRVGAAKRKPRPGHVAHGPDRAHMDQPPHPALRRGPRQCRGGLGLNPSAHIPWRAMRSVGEVDYNFRLVEMARPIGRGNDLADRAKRDARNGFGRDARSPKHDMAALDQIAAQRAADEPGRTGHQNTRQALPLAAEPAIRLPKRSEDKRIREVPVPRQGCKNAVPPRGSPILALPDNMRSVSSVPGAAQRPKLLFLVTEDWYFWSHRLPVARAARDAGFEVVVATRVRAHGGQISAEGFALRPIAWRRRGDGFLGAGRAISEIARLYRAERPDLIHHVALKPVLFGGLARRLAFARPADAPVSVGSVMGLGSGFSDTSFAARLCRPSLGLALRLMVGKDRDWVVVQNPEDHAALARFGIDPGRIVLIRGSGVDAGRFAPLPEPNAETVTVALVARMLREKGVLEAVGAIRRLRARGLPIALVLAGPTDPDNRGSLTPDVLSALAAEPGIEWLGPVADVRTVWRRAAIAVLPSTYGEGVPKALLEAAACARPIVATDAPGCREVVRPGETGILVPPHNVEELAEAIAALAGDPARRSAMGRAGRALIQREFTEDIVARQTLVLYQTALQEGAMQR
jgi:glycosyltransferase involved in cell wall biosynthesis